MNTFDSGERKTDTESESMEQRQIAEQNIIGSPFDGTSERLNIGIDVAVSQHDTFGNTGGAGGEENDKKSVEIFEVFG